MTNNVMTNNAKKQSQTDNIVFEIVRLTVVNSTFVILLGSCTNIALTFLKYSTIANT